MTKAYLSFLGTNDYLPCTYYLGDKSVENVRFVQEATIFLKCADWSADDRILIFTTRDAYEKNWLDDGQINIRSGEKIIQEGLERRLINLNLHPRIIKVDVPEGKSEGEIWEIFQTVYENLKPEDHVVIDITHAFRSIPLLAIIILNYAKILKNITLDGIYYGAFETLGSIHEAGELPLEDRKVPIFDLTPFAKLMEWSLAETGWERNAILSMISPGLECQNFVFAGSRFSVPGYGFESFQNAVCARVDAQRRDITPTNDAFRINDKNRLLRLSVAIPVYAVLAGNCAFGLKIRHKRKVQFAVLAEGEMAPDTVDRDTDDLRFELGELGLQFVVEH